jgi:hypothetical protein
MGVAIALGVAGLAGGILGGMGEAANAKAQYTANKIEVERNNFQNALANDKKNMASARANAMRRYNNEAIQKAAVNQYADDRRMIRESFQANSKGMASMQISQKASLIAEATGKGLRGGMVSRMKTIQRDQAQSQRQNNRNQAYSQSLSSLAAYNGALNGRDLMGRNEANIFMPGSSGVAPGDNTLGMLAGGLQGGVSGFSSGLNIQNQVKDAGGWGELFSF